MDQEKATKSKGKGRLEDANSRIPNPVIPLPANPDDNIEDGGLEATVVHHGIFCDGFLCKNDPDQGPIEGARYKCTKCADVDFCLDCLVDETNPHDKTHPLMKCITRAAFLDMASVPHDRRGDVLESVRAENRVVDIRHLLGQLPTSPENSRREDSIIPVRGARDSRHPKDTPRGAEVQERKASNDGVTYYKIEEDGNVTVETRPFGPSDRSGQERVVMHHPDTDLLMDVLTGKITEYTYEDRKFYDDARAGKPATRLVEILPGEFDDKLECKLIPVDLDHHPPYTALSYTWKETAFERANWSKWNKETDEAFRSMMEFLHPIYCDGQFIKITTGLRDAIRRLRDPVERKTYWIDQICINQASANERTFQVSEMRLIYNRAERVVLWVGDEDEDTLHALDLIRKLAPRCRLPEAALPTPGELANDSSLQLPEPNSSEWISLLEFFNRPVFQRMWCIQEITLGQQIVVRCGDHELQWGQLAVVGRLLCQGPWLTRLGFNKGPMRSNGQPNYVGSLAKMREDFQMGKEIPLEALLGVTRAFKVSDPRDRVYAILGIRAINPAASKSGPMVPDYNKSVEDVFIEAAKAIIEHEQSFDICASVGYRSPDGVAKLPSWVPDFNDMEHHIPICGPEPIKPYKAAGDSKVLAVWPFEDSMEILATSSHCVDRILLVSEKGLAPKEDLPEVFLSWSYLAAHLGPKYQGRESTLSVFAKTCVGDVDIRWKNTPAPQSYLHDVYCFILNHMYRKIEKGDRSFEKYMTPLVAEMAEEIDKPDGGGFDDQSQLGVSKALVTCASKQMVVTESGLLGIAPLDAKQGDEIHIVSGASSPFVLRPGNSPGDVGGEDDESALFEMVGAAYVHGIMQGESLQREDFEWSEIFIR